MSVGGTRWVFAIALLAAAARGNDLYIAQNLTGAGDGSSCANAYARTFFNTPANWTNFAGIIGKIGPGTTVHLCGTFTAPANTDGFLAFQGGGAPGAPVTLVAEPGLLMQAPYWALGGAIAAQGVSWVTLDGRNNGTIQATANGTRLANQAPLCGGSYCTSGISLVQCNNCTVQNWTIANIYVNVAPNDETEVSDSTTGIFFNGGNNAVISGNTVHDTKWCINYGYWPGQTTQNVRIFSNKTYNCDHGVAVFSDNSGAILNDLYIYANSIHDGANWDDVQDNNHHDGIHISPTQFNTQLNNAYIYNNDIYGNWGFGCNAFIYVAGDPDTANAETITNANVFNNVLVNSSAANTCANGLIQDFGARNTLIANNTLIGPTSGAGQGIITEEEGPYHTQIKNNIISGFQNGIYVAQGANIPASDYNDFSNVANIAFVWGTDCCTALQDWKAQAGTPDLHSVGGNPNLSGAYLPQGSSPVIRAGANLTSLAVTAGLANLTSDKAGVRRPGGTCSVAGSSGCWEMGAFQSGTSIPVGPVITSLNPNSAIAGGPAFTLTVNGSGFVAGSIVQMGSSALATTVVSANQATAFVPANLISNPGSPLVGIVNPGGVVSNLVGFAISSSALAITSLSPSSIAPGYPFPFLTLTVNGSGFASGSFVQWNGQALATSLVNSTQLTASAPSNLYASLGTAVVTVWSGGIVSNGVTFTIGASNPTISSVNPSFATAGGAGFTLTINGSGFASGMTVRLGPSALAATFVSSTQLNAFVPASLIANAGNLLLQATNSGASSNIYTFPVNLPTTLAIITASPLPSGTVGFLYSLTLGATGGTTPYQSWAVVAGTPPPGLALTTPGGVLTGVPVTAGTFTFTALVTDTVGAMAASQFTLAINPGPAISASGVVNGANYAGGSMSPGEIVAIFGSGLGPSTLQSLQLDNRGYVSTSLAGTQVLFDGVAAPLIYTQAGQVGAVVPYEISGKNLTQVQVIYLGQGSNVVGIPVVSVMPAVFTQDTSGRGPGAIVNQDQTVNSPSNPAPAGSIVAVYATGEGQTNPPGVNGKPDDNPAPVPLAQPLAATIGGLNAQVVYAGGTPGLVAGVLQVNVRVPQGVSPGGAVPLALTIAGQTTQGNVTLAVSAGKN